MLGCIPYALEPLGGNLGVYVMEPSLRPDELHRQLQPPQPCDCRPERDGDVNGDGILHEREQRVLQLLDYDRDHPPAEQRLALRRYHQLERPVDGSGNLGGWVGHLHHHPVQ